jgi:NCS1 family nucleobase:cation symporter-1
MRFSVPTVTLPSKEAVKARCTSLHAWELQKQASSIAPDHVWSNAGRQFCSAWNFSVTLADFWTDQDPVPREKRTWGPWAFVGYWLSDLLTVATWEVGSSILVVGLGTTDAILIMLVAGISNMIPTSTYPLSLQQTSTAALIVDVDSP